VIGFLKFDAEAFGRRLVEYSDLELIKLGRACAPGASPASDPLTRTQNATKYELCRQEWRRRHPKRRLAVS
jgi:hypothetical protein